MSKSKPTPGPWIVDDAQPGDAFRYVMHGDDDSFGYICRISTNGNANAESDARLIAEAGTVFHNTGLSPVQLVEMVKELRTAVRGLDEAYCRSGEPLSKAERHEDRLRLIAARAALAKCEGVK